MTGGRMEVGFGDMLRFGAAVPALILVSALIIAVFAAAGADANLAITVAFTAAFVLAIALEILRRTVLVRRASGGHGAVRVFRSLV